MEPASEVSQQQGKITPAPWWRQRELFPPFSMPPGGKEHKVLEGLLNPALGSSLLFVV